ncbi:uncharacterized protein JCM6883_006261 [Sporobolomyces salmoneus]|uniref:uncharacterized protein n=1 Tax=Sporobolomyces salmoneus TaxID=183962 RepID=UPI00317ADD2C
MLSRTLLSRTPIVLRATRSISTVPPPPSSTSSSTTLPSSPVVACEPPLTTTDLPPPPPPLITEAPPTPIVKQPVGAFRGGLIGFLLGLTTLGGYGYYLLLSDYEKASKQLVESVKNLESSTSLISSQLDRISLLESRLRSLESTQVSSKQLDSFRNEYKKLSESQHLDLINLKAHVWSIEQDLVNLEKRNETERKKTNQVVTLRI